MSGDGHGHHAHAVGSGADARYLATALALIVGFLVAEVVAALVGHSLALLADAAHMLTDAAALGASLWTLRLVRRPASDAMTFGFRRAEVISAAVNGMILLVAGILVLVEAVRRLVAPSPVTGWLLVCVAALGVVVNAAATLSLGRANRSSLNVAGAFAHIVTDLWAFLATLVAGVVILFTRFERADSIASLLVVALMVRAALPLLRTTGRILLEGTPEGVDLDVVRRHLLELPDVRSVHDLHAWVVASDLPAVSAHVVVADEAFATGGIPRLLDEMQACLTGHFDVEHSTFQLEPDGHAAHEAPGHP